MPYTIRQNALDTVLSRKSLSFCHYSKLNPGAKSFLICWEAAAAIPQLTLMVDPEAESYREAARGCYLEGL